MNHLKVNVRLDLKLLLDSKFVEKNFYRQTKVEITNSQLREWEKYQKIKY